jgi:hypothetical protein
VSRGKGEGSRVKGEEQTAQAPGFFLFSPLVLIFLGGLGVPLEGVLKRILVIKSLFILEH